MSSTDTGTIAIYIATHNQSIKQTSDKLIPIHTGAAFSSLSLCKLRDDMGDNISIKNHEFCELTALYWIWKNDMHDFTGLSHYRRRFKLNLEKVPDILAEYDVITPPPYFFRISLKDEYKLRHIETDLNLLIDVMHNLHPDYDSVLKNVLNCNMLIPFNMLISRREFLFDYCQWLFPILFELEPKINFNNRDNYQKRVFGFLSERLFTAYIQYRHLKIMQCTVEIPETSTPGKHLKYICGLNFNRWYFKRKR